VDYPGKFSFLIYTQGCNLSCSFCFSKHLIPIVEGNLSWNDIYPYIKSQKHIEAIVFTGGEPTIHDITPMIQDCLNSGYLVGLHTNGRGDYISKIIPLVDYVLLSKYTSDTQNLVMNLKKDTCQVELIDVLYT
jgi:pyruvate formate lyase activating enzyme